MFVEVNISRATFLKKLR